MLSQTHKEKIAATDLTVHICRTGWEYIWILFLSRTIFGFYNLVWASVKTNSTCLHLNSVLEGKDNGNKETVNLTLQ